MYRRIFINIITDNLLLHVHKLSPLKSDGEYVFVLKVKEQLRVKVLFGRCPSDVFPIREARKNIAQPLFFLQTKQRDKADHRIKSKCFVATNVRNGTKGTKHSQRYNACLRNGKAGTKH